MARDPFQTFSLSIQHTEIAEMRGYGLDNCVARLQVRCSVAAFYYLRVNVLSLAFRLILSYNIISKAFIKRFRLAAKAEIDTLDDAGLASI